MQKILLVLTVTNETRLLCISARHVVGCLCCCDCRIVCFSIILEWIISWHLHCKKSHRVAIILKWFWSLQRFCEWHNDTMARSFVTALVEKCINDVAHLNFQKFLLRYSFLLDNIFHFSELPGWCLPKIIYFYYDKFGSRVVNVIFSESGMNDNNIEWD